MKIAFILLCHQNPQRVERVIKNLILLESSICVIHWDKKFGESPILYLKEKIKEKDRIFFAKRVRCKWGDWSLVEATINSIEKIIDVNFKPDFVYLLGGNSDYMIKSYKYLSEFLERNKGVDFIESYDCERFYWVAGGPQNERYEFYHFFNWQTHHNLAKFLFNLQKKFKIKRVMPAGLHPHIGSQWWVLSWDSIIKMREFWKNKKIVNFFKKTLIPDELFFQTIVRAVSNRIANKILTLYQFTDYFKPYVFSDRHFCYLLNQPFFFARKIYEKSNILLDLCDLVWDGTIQSPIFEDEEIGLKSLEYKAFIKANRYSGYTRSIIGDYIARATAIKKFDKNLAIERGYNMAVYAETDEWLKGRQTPVIIFFITFEEERLKELNKYFSKTCDKDFVFLENIFCSYKINYGNSINEVAGYKIYDIHRRNEASIDFCLDLIYFYRKKRKIGIGITINDFLKNKKVFVELKYIFKMFIYLDRMPDNLMDIYLKNIETNFKNISHISNFYLREYLLYHTNNEINEIINHIHNEINEIKNQFKVEILDFKEVRYSLIEQI